MALNSPKFNAAQVISLINSRMSTKNPYARHFNLGWIRTLQNYSKVSMMDYLPGLLDGLFEYLADDKQEVYSQADRQVFHLHVHSGKF